MKKAQSEPTSGLTTAVKLLIVIITIGILILLLLSTGLITEAHTLFCTYITRMGATARGIMITAVVGAIASVVGFYNAMIWTSSGCYSLEGAVKCTALSVAGTAIIFSFISAFSSGLPLFYCNSPAQNIGSYLRPVGIDNFKTKLAETTLDCYYMYTAGEYNPLFGKTPPNPKNCYIINFNLAESVNLVELIDFMSEESLVYQMGTFYRFSYDNAEIVTLSIDYGEATGIKETNFSKKMRTITYEGKTWDMVAYYHQHRDRCGNEHAPGTHGIDICLFKPSFEDRGYLTNHENYVCYCGIEILERTSRNFTLMNIPMYASDYWYNAGPVALSSLEESTWAIEIFSGSYSVSSYMSRLGDNLNYRINGEVVSEADMGSIDMKSGRVVVAYKDYWKYWKMDKPNYANYECNITPKSDLKNKDEVFWCFIDIDASKCSPAGQTVCMDSAQGNAVYDTNRHEYIGKCLDEDGTNGIQEVMSCSTDYCGWAEDPTTLETHCITNYCACKSVSGVRGCYSPADVLCELIE